MLSKVCIPIALESDDIDRLDQIVDRGRAFSTGDCVYRQGDHFSSLFALRSGCVKTVSESASGKEQVVGFYFPGEVFGLDGVGSREYQSTAVALEDTSLCRIPYSQLTDLSLELPSLQRHCMELMSNEIVADHDLHTLLGSGDARSRVATFLLSVSARNLRRKLPGDEINLAMSRGDIANYLGLTQESVSRILGALKQDKVLSVANKSIRILDQAALREFTIS